MFTSTTSQQQTRSNRLVVVVIVLLVLAVGAWYLLFHARAPKPAAPVPRIQATTTHVQRQDVPVYLTGVGTVTANASVLVRARVDGQLVKVGFAEGQDVKAGQMLAQLDPAPLQAQLAQVTAQKARDQAQLSNAQLDLKRFQTLIKQDAATQQQLDTQQALVNQLAAAVKSDEAQIQGAQVQLAFTTIAAPISGRVGARLVDPGNLVHATDSTGLVVINQIDPITVVFTLPEESLPQINKALQTNGAGLEVQTFTRDTNQVLSAGKLILLNNQIDTTTGTVSLKGIFANASHNLWPGQYVNVHLVLGQRKQALTVPAATVQRSQNSTYAYVVDANGVARIQPITVASIQDGIAVVETGLNAGDRVVVDGQYKLQPGSHVIEAGSAAKPGAAASSANSPAAGSAAGS